MKKYAVIGVEILLSIILIVVIVFLAIRITGTAGWYSVWGKCL